MSQNQSLTFSEILDQFRWHWRSLDEWKASSWFTKINYVNFFMFVSFVAFAIWQARGKVQQAKKKGLDKPWIHAPEFPEIEQLQDFSWEDEEPLKLRTFKPKFYLTMALRGPETNDTFGEPATQKLNPSEYILMDNKYVERLDYHKEILQKHHDIAICVNNEKRATVPVRELYTWLMGTYLPQRYPTMFKLHHATFETGDMYMLENLVTKAVLPAQASQSSNIIHLLENLGKTLDEDFLFLVPEDTEEGKEGDAKYILEACVVFGPSGWNPQEKIGLPLAKIHTPVPGYSKILEGSMDRFFSKIAVGEYVKRTNWGITENGELFSFGSSTNHAHEGDDIAELPEIDPENTFLRCERQTLHRLPKSKGIVFAFKTYMYSMKELKDEGLGEELAAAIDGLKDGNVPAMHFYKRGPAWGEAVKRYLRS